MLPFLVSMSSVQTVELFVSFLDNIMEAHVSLLASKISYRVPTGTQSRHVDNRTI